jgi:2-methylcitrate dehydratase PrpD
VLYDVVRAGPFSDAILAFEKRVEVVATDAFDNLYPRLWPARITIRLTNNSEHTLTLEHPPGDPETPLTFAQLQAKSPAYTAEMHALCESAVTDGPAALLAALD